MNAQDVMLKSKVEGGDRGRHQEEGAWGELVWGDGDERNRLQVGKKGPWTETGHEIPPELAPLGAVECKKRDRLHTGGVLFKFLPTWVGRRVAGVT